MNEFEPARIYDIDLAARLEHQSVPEMPPKQVLVYANAPYVSLLFRPLARLPYRWAYCVWLVMSMALYVFGLSLLLDGFPAGHTRVGFLIALSSAAFLFETWIGGQVSVIAFAAMSLFAYGLRRKQLFLAGLALGLAAYKPPLVLIPAVMMVFGGCWPSLAGLCTSSALMAALSIHGVGLQGCVRWFATLRLYGQLATAEHSVLKRMKYVDLTSFFHTLIGDASGAASVCALLASGALFVVLASAWWQSRRSAPETRNPLWAATLSWALIINLYVPIYDTIVVAPAVVLAASALEARTKDERDAFTVWLAVLYVSPWITQFCAEFLRTQVFTLVLAGFGYWSLTLARSEAHATLLDAAAREALTAAP